MIKKSVSVYLIYKMATTQTDSTEWVSVISKNVRKEIIRGNIVSFFAENCLFNLLMKCDGRCKSNHDLDPNLARNIKNVVKGPLFNIPFLKSNAKQITAFVMDTLGIVGKEVFFSMCFNVLRNVNCNNIKKISHKFGNFEVNFCIPNDYQTRAKFFIGIHINFNYEFGGNFFNITNILPEVPPPQKEKKEKEKEKDFVNPTQFNPVQDQSIGSYKEKLLKETAVASIGDQILKKAIDEILVSKKDDSVVPLPPLSLPLPPQIDADGLKKMVMEVATDIVKQVIKDISRDVIKEVVRDVLSESKWKNALTLPMKDDERKEYNEFLQSKNKRLEKEVEYYKYQVEKKSFQKFVDRHYDDGDDDDAEYADEDDE